MSDHLKDFMDGVEILKTVGLKTFTADAEQDIAAYNRICNLEALIQPAREAAEYLNRHNDGPASRQAAANLNAALEKVI